MCSQVPESQATVAPTAPANNSSEVGSAGCSMSGSQGAAEPMDTESQRDRRTPADQKAGSRRRPEADGKVQADGRAPGDRAQTTWRTQADRETQEGTATRGSERPESGGSPQQAAAVPGGAGTQPSGSLPTALEGPSEKPATSHRPSSRAPERPPAEGPRSPPITECPERAPEGPPAPEERGPMLRSERAASRRSEEAPPGPLAGSLPLAAQRPPEGSLEKMGGESRRGLEWSGPVEDKPEGGPFQRPREERPAAVPSADLGGCPPAGLRPEAPTLPSSPGTRLTPSSREGPPSPPTAQHRSAAAFLPSGDQALPSAARPLPLGPGTHPQRHPPESMAASSEGACAEVPGVEGRSPGPRSCDPGLIDSLKNYLLLLLKLSSPDSQEEAATGGLAPSPTLLPSVEVAGLSPRTSRRILEHVENDHLVRSAQTLLLSPCTSRRLTGLLDREVQAGRQALAAARAPGPSALTVPAIVVGEEEGPGLPSEGSSEGEGEGSFGTSQESSLGGPLLEEGGQAASGQGAFSADSGAQEPFQGDEPPGEALAGLPAATPEELALGARRKRFLPKVRAAGDGEATKPEERESPTVSPRGPRKGLAPGSPGTQGREKHSPPQGRKAGMLEVPRTEEEPAPGDPPGSSPRAGRLDAEQALGEGRQEAPDQPRKAEALLKGEQWGGAGQGSRERAAGGGRCWGHAPLGT